MSIVNMVASGGGDIEIKSADFNVGTATSIDTITTSAIPSWYILVHKISLSYSAYNGYPRAVNYASSDGSACAMYTTGTSSFTVASGTVTVTTSITSGKLRFSVSGTPRFNGSYTLYYVE